MACNNTRQVTTGRGGQSTTSDLRTIYSGGGTISDLRSTVYSGAGPFLFHGVTGP